MRYFQRLTAIGMSTALLSALSACTYIIPADPSAPRYNNVLGERRTPERNRPHVNAVRGSSLAPVAQEAPLAAMPSSAPVPEVVANDLPPATMPVAPVALAPAMPELPPVDATTRATAEKIDPSIRQIPSENTPYNVAENRFHTVPNYTMPVGSDAPAARMNNVRRDLESARGQADAARDALARDAAAEPSLLPLPEQRAPVGNAPVTSVPTPQTYVTPTPYTPAPVTPPVAYAPPAPPPSYIALPPPPPPLMAKAPEVKPATASVPVTQVAMLASPRSFDPMAIASPAPITLRAPGALPITTVVEQPAPVTLPVQHQRSMSGFNPMAVPTAPTAHSGYAGEGFMAPSRYVTRRN
jgi:hypothetical protein